MISTSTEPQILNFIFQKKDEKCQLNCFFPSSMWVSVNSKTIALRVTVNIFTAKTVNVQNVTVDSADMKTNVLISVEKSVNLCIFLKIAHH